MLKLYLTFIKTKHYLRIRSEERREKESDRDGERKRGARKKGGM